MVHQRDHRVLDQRTLVAVAPDLLHDVQLERVAGVVQTRQVAELTLREGARGRVHAHRMDVAQRRPALRDLQEAPVVRRFGGAFESERFQLQVTLVIEARRSDGGRVGAFALLHDHLEGEQGRIEVGDREQPPPPCPA